MAVDRRVVDGPWAHRRAGDLVKLLALAPKHRLHRERVVDILWPQLETDAAFANLHKAACLARKALGAEAIVLRGGWVELWPDEFVVTDAEDFEAVADEALKLGDEASCDAAATRYTGDLLPEHPYDEWASEAREQIRRRYLALLRRARRWDTLVSCDPADEEAHRHLIRAHLQEGRRTDALRQLQQLQDVLAELGFEPSPETLAISEILARPGPPAAFAAPFTPLFSREKELARALTVWREAARGRGGTLLVTGEEGAGKTHFCEWLIAEIAKEGGTITRGSAQRTEGIAPYGPVLEALDRLLTAQPELEGDLTEGARDVLGRLMGQAPVAGEPRVGRQPILSAATQLITTAARGHGLVFWIDDFHVADEDTVQLVHYLARMARLHPVLLLVSFRNEDTLPVIAECRASLLATRAAIEIVLGPLPLAATAALVGRLTGGRASEASVSAVHELAGGNAFFVEELAASMPSTGDLQIPRRVCEILDARLQSLDPGVRLALERVAVAGTSFDAEGLGALADLDELATFKALDMALRSGFVVETDEGYRFRHALLRDALLASLPRHRRRAAHLHAAERLAVNGAPPGRVAHHLLEGGHGVDAVPWLERAARDAAAVGAVADARALAEQGLVHAPRRANLLELRAESLFATGDPAAITAYTEAIAAARGDQRRRLRIRRARVAVLLGDVDAAMDSLEGVVGSSAAEEVRILVARGYASWYTGDLVAAERCAEEARRMAIAGNLAAELTDVVTLRSLVAHSLGVWPQQVEMDLLDTNRAPQLAAKVHDGHLCVAEMYLFGGHPYERIAEFARHLKCVAERNGAERGRAFATVVLGEAELLAGKLDDAVAHLREGAELQHQIGSVGGEALALHRLAEAAVLAGELEEARGLLRRALALARQSRLLVRHLLQRIYGTMITAAPNAAAAVAVVDEAELSIVGPREECRMCAITLALPAAHACARVGDLPRAKRYLETARDAASLWEGGAWQAPITEAQAAVEMAGGERERASALFLDAAELFRKAGQSAHAERCRTASESGNAPARKNRAE